MSSRERSQFSLDRRVVLVGGKYVTGNIHSGKIDPETLGAHYYNFLDQLLERFPLPDGTVGDLDRTPFRKALRPGELTAVGDLAAYMVMVRKPNIPAARRFYELYQEDRALLDAQIDRPRRDGLVGAAALLVSGAIGWKLRESGLVVPSPQAAAQPTPFPTPDLAFAIPTPNAEQIEVLRRSREESEHGLTADPSPYSTRGISVSYVDENLDRETRAVDSFQVSAKPNTTTVANNQEIPGTGIKLTFHEHSSGGGKVPVLVIMGENGVETPKILKPVQLPLDVQSDPRVVTFTETDGVSRKRKIQILNPKSAEPSFQLTDVYAKSTHLIKKYP